VRVWRPDASFGGSSAVTDFNLRRTILFHGLAASRGRQGRRETSMHAM
jgi:hypothetical protein